MFKRLFLFVIFMSTTFCAAQEMPFNTSNTISLEQALIIDVRTPQEYEAGHLKNAILIEYQNIGEQITSYTTDKNTPIILYCRSGNRSHTAMVILKSLGYQQVQNAGGFENLRQLGFEVE